MKKEKKVLVATELPTSLAKKIKKAAADEGRSVSGYLRFLLKKLYGDEK